MRQNRHSTEIYVVHRNTLSDSFRIQIVWFQLKQDSDRIRISFFINRIGSDSENPLSDHLCSLLSTWSSGKWVDNPQFEWLLRCIWFFFWCA